jgi:hypothetical protein
MQTYRVTARSIVLETIEVQANSAQEAERMVEEALNSGKSCSDPRFHYIGAEGEDDWTVMPEYTC